MCDFDLVEKLPEMHIYLSEYCKQWNQNSDEYKLMLRDSIEFNKFQEKLSEYEAIQDPNMQTNSTDGSGIPKKQWKFRNKLYHKYNHFQCVQSNINMESYFDCLYDLRKNMTNFIP